MPESHLCFLLRGGSVHESPIPRKRDAPKLTNAAPSQSKHVSEKLSSFALDAAELLAVVDREMLFGPVQPAFRQWAFGELVMDIDQVIGVAEEIPGRAAGLDQAVDA
jgi:hypothetical protein